MTNTTQDTPKPTYEELESQNRSLKFQLRQYTQIVSDPSRCAYAHLTHMEMANKVRMLMRSDLGFEGVVQGARDRIVYLANRVAELEGKPPVDIPEVREGEPDPALKGKKDGNCNVTACQQPGATWYNKSTQKYYCTKCADQINSCNMLESVKMYGTALCINHGETKTRITD